jgi:hypothetical protein
MDMSDARAWRKSSYSGANNDCVEVALPEEGLAIRDTKNRSGGMVTVGATAAAAFLAAVKQGRFDA